VLNSRPPDGTWENMQEDATRRELPFPDGGIVTELWPLSEVEVPDLATVKDFLRFYIATSRPQLTNRPTVDFINTMAD
jgi:hypothetical protein